MLEISSVNTTVSSPVSAKSEAPVATLGVNSKVLAQASEEQTKVSEKSVRQAVKQANIDIAGSNEQVGFVFEKRLGQLYVQILDKQSGAVVKEIPPKAFIEHAAYMKELAGILLDRNA